MKTKRKITKKYEKFNHYHEIIKSQQFVNFGIGNFIADKKWNYIIMLRKN